MHSSTETPFQDFLAVIRRRAWVPILCVLLLPGLALAFTQFQEEKYTATAKLLFRSADSPSQVLGGQDETQGSGDPGRDAATNQELVALPAVSDDAAKALGVPVAGKITVTPSGDSDVISVTAQDSKPALASGIANGYARAYIQFRRRADERSIDAARGRIQRRVTALQTRVRELDQQASERGSSTPPSARRERELAASRLRFLRNQDSELATLAAVQGGNAELVQRARTPSTPTSPDPVRNVLIGIALGLLLGVGLAVLLDILDRRMRDPRSVQNIFDQPVLGTISETPALADPDTAIAPADAEAFRMLAANLQHLDSDRPPKSILITSSAPGDGKSTIAWNLAMAVAESGKRAILVEAELRRPTMVERYHLPVGPGLTDILASGVPAREAITEVVAGQANGRGAHSTLSVIVAGGTHGNPNRLLDSEQMQELVRSLEEEYDIVVIDAPPPTVVSETISLLTQVEGVLLVVRFGTTNERSAERLRHQLEQLDASVLGVVINGVRANDAYYGQARSYAEAYAQPAG